MALNSRRRDRGGLDAWPGYVDALSTLLMVIIFVLLVFVLAQGFLGAALTSRDQALEQLNRQMAELAQQLNLERAEAGSLRNSLARAQQELRVASDARERLTAERDRAAARVGELELAARTQATTLAELTAGLGTERQARAVAETEAARVARDLAEARRQLEAMRAEMAALERTVRTDRATLEARLSELARISEQLRAMTALRDRMERDMAAQTTAAQQATRLSESAQAQVALLTRQIEELRSQLGRISTALELAEAQGRDKDVQIATLGSRLNAALAAQVETLQRYRSDFFGRLREVLGNRPEIRVVGDRFVFQSEILFPPGSADLSEAGQAQIRRVGGVLRDISRRIPADVNWVLRVDGHADRTPISNQRFASNWELSAARAIAVARLLVQEGLPANRVAPTAFGENQPMDQGETAEARARNRRIEFRLTDR